MCVCVCVCVWGGGGGLYNINNILTIQYLFCVSA